MKPIDLLWALLWFLPAAGLAAETARPNILIILADDIGYSDIGCYGGEINTPNLDRLAAGGLRFTQFYNTARCCPTRASLLTGLHPHQAGVGHMMEDRGHDGYRGTLNQHCVTIAEVLKPAGYRNYAVGKWHVTPGQTAKALAETRNWPLQRGFDRYYGTIHGAGSYFDPSALVRDNKLITMANDPEYQPKEYYYTNAIGEQAVRFMRDHVKDHHSQPFFLYAAFTAAHWPLHARESDIAKYKGRYDDGYEPVRSARLAKQKALGLLDDRWTLSPPAERWDAVADKPFESRCMEVYAAQIDSLDQNIGRIVAELTALGQLENTLIFYLQDNGACAELVGRGTKPAGRTDGPTLPPMDKDAQQFDSRPAQTRDGRVVRQGLGVLPGGADTYLSYGRGWASVSNTPFREYKHWTHEGGISTPLIVHWPMGMAASRYGRIETQPGQLVDLMATCLDAGRAVYPTEFQGEMIKPCEGASLRPAFGGATIDRTKPLVWEHEGNRAIRDGQWKLVAKENAPWELYNLETDRTEGNDLASAEPGRVQTMGATWQAWAVRANVLPVGAWRGTDNTPLSRETRFSLKINDQLERREAPAIAKRAFTVTARFTAGPECRGVVVAQGGSTVGYALYADTGALHFMVRDRTGESATTTKLSAGSHRAIARLDEQGQLTLQLDGGPITKSEKRLIISQMPADGLDVGSDTGGPVGPYTVPNPFTGEIESVLIELAKP